jgi:hypothetical protein
MSNKSGQPFMSASQRRKLKERENRPKVERLVECAIRQPDGTVIHGFKSHTELRQANDYPEQYHYEQRPGDTPGFWTSAERFLTRRDSIYFGVMAGQLDKAWMNVRRDLLSSDINW